MKKLLGILILGLLLSGNAYAKSFSAHVKNYYNFKEGFYGSSKKGFKEAKRQAFESCRAKSKENDLNPKACLLYALQSSTGWETLTDREYEEVFWNKYVDQFEKTLKPDEIIQGTKLETKKEKKEKKEKIELAKIIDKAKTTCQTLGFEQGTDKFSDCTLKLYSQEVDNKVALEVAKQKSSSGSSNSGTMVIYDPVRDRQNKIDKGMEMITGRCTLGTDC